MPTIHEVPLSVISKVIFTGRVPSKKNAKRKVTTPKGKSLLLPSKAYEKWHNEHLPDLQKMVEHNPEWRLIPPYRIAVNIYPPDLIGADLSNKIESIQDILVEAEILEDDNWFKLTKIIPEFVAIDRKNPRYEVTIHSAAQRVEFTIPEIEYPKEVKPKKSKKEKVSA